MIARTIAGATLRRTLRDRTSVFFIVVLPILVIVLVGSSTMGGERFVVAVHDAGGGELGRELVADLERAEAIEVRRFDDVEDLRRAVRRSEASAGVVVPAGLDDAVRAGEPAALGVVSQPASSTGLAAAQAVRAVVADRATVVSAAGFAAGEVGDGAAFDDLLATAATAAAEVEALEVRTTVRGESRFLPLGFTYSASTMLVLFVFVNALAGGADLIAGRKLGLHERMLAAPVRPRSVIAGEAATYLLLALLQSALIVGVGALLFEVDWGDPLAAAALVVVWAAVGASAGMLLGSLLRSPEQATAIGPTVGIGLAMLGGCMWPLEIVPPVMQTIGHLVPHGWAVDGWIELLSRGGGIGDIARHLAVLAGFAVVFGAVATHRLHRQLTA